MKDIHGTRGRESSAAEGLPRLPGMNTSPLRASSAIIVLRQVTEALCKEGGANPDWKFLHCLPRKPDEVDDEARSYLRDALALHDAMLIC